MKLRLAFLLAFLTGSGFVALSTAYAVGCGAHPADADWFFLGDAPAEYATAASRVLKAIRGGLDPEMLTHEPACLHVTIVGDLARRSTQLKRPHDFHARALPSNTVGFHLDKLGADDTVFVSPSSSIPLEVVMLHESLHVLSHRFARETMRRGFNLLDEGVTDYITRELAVLSLGYERETMHSGYDDAVRFIRALMQRLGDQGTQLLADCYLRDGYDAFEKTVDRRLGISLGGAARDVQKDDSASAIAELRAAAR